MAIGWLTVLSNVPWSDVIRNAPAVAEGAKKLWGAVSRSPRSPSGAATPGDAAPPALDARIAALEAALADQHAQLLASSELIKALAEHNTQLVARIDAQRRIALWWGAAATVSALLAAAALALQWLR